MATRRVVVTGASSGIGAATARLFREHGWDVVAVARREDRLRALAEEIGADVFVADLTKQADVDALRSFVASSGPLHALVNNAGGAFGLASVEDSDPDDWQRMFDINVLGTKRVITALLPLLRKGAASAGSADIMTITSIAGHVAYEGGSGYNAAKFAEHAMVAVLRLELAGEPIRVLEIAPGMVKTDEFSLTRFGGDKKRADAVYENVPEPLTAEDIAITIVQAMELPSHINLDLITIKPVAQAAPHKLVRGPLKPKS
jgi:NADP-dependent 3-hydroxy acid dehydrogenase YdfG